MKARAGTGAGRRLIRLAAVSSLCVTEAVSAQAPTIEQEVRDNLLGQPIGAHTVADLDLPDEFVRRVTDRVIRSSWRERAHLVAVDLPADESPTSSAPTSRRPWWLLGVAAAGLIVAVIALGGLWRRGAER